MKSKSEKLCLLSLTLAGGSAALCFLLLVSLNRFVAMDEGFYLMAAKLVDHGRTVYLDFFYPQTPLFPYFYGVWFRIFGTSWNSARILSALLTFGTGMLLFYRMLKGSGINYAFTAIVLFISSNLCFAWFTTAKPYALSVFFLTAAYLLLNHPEKVSKSRHLIFAGAAFGCAVNTRLYFAALAPVYLFYVCCAGKTGRGKANGLILFAAGALITLTPHLYFLFQDSAAYWFNNIGYHLLRGSKEVLENQDSKGKILLFLLGFQESNQLKGIQFPLLFYGTVLYVALCLKRRKLPDPAAPLSLGIFFISFVPSPSFIQYFCAAVPFLTVSILFFVRDFAADQLHRVLRGTILPYLVGLICILIYLWSVPGDLARYIITGVGVSGVRGEANRFEAKLSSVSEVSKVLDEHIREGEVVLSQWPGFLLETKGIPFPGYENHFWVRVSEKLTYQERRHFKIGSRDELREIVSGRRTRIIVIDKRKAGRYFSKKALKQAGFIRVAEIGRIAVLVLEGSEFDRLGEKYD